MWAAYQGRGKFRCLGPLDLSERGWPLWHNRYGRIALCQFRDHILTATDAHPRDRPHVIELARQVLMDCWDLQVVCDCITKTMSACTGACRTSVAKAVGVVMILNPDGYGTAFTKPAALNPRLELKLAPPPQKTPEYTHRCH